MSNQSSAGAIARVFYCQQLRDQIQRAGLMTSEKLDADFRNIESAAYRTTFTDALGHQYDPVTREEVLQGLRRDDIVDANLGKLASIIAEALPASQH